MDNFHKPIELKKLKLSSNIFYAPLAGCSDLPYRRMAKRYNPGLFFCEMVKMDALIRHDPGTYRLLDYEPDMHPIGAQLVGSKREIAGQAARIVEELGFDSLDLNCGCPVDNITKDGSGSGMLKTPALIGDVLAEMVAAVSIPVTVKIRIGWDDGEHVATQITQIAEAAGACAITIHGRTREQGYKGSANWQPIKECVEAAKSIKVIGNGDVMCGESARAIFEQTKCHGVLVARGTMGQPWIVEDIRRALEGLPPIERTPLMIRDALLEHLQEIRAYQSYRRSLLDLRRVSCWYLKNGMGVKRLREALSRIDSIEKAIEIVMSHDWES